MSNSNTILQNLLTDLQVYQLANLPEFNFIFEDEIRDDSQLIERYENPGFIIGMDESDATVTIRTQTGISNTVNQGYDIKIFFVIPRENDYTEDVARPIRKVKDMILQWINQPLNCPLITSNLLMTLNYISNTSVTRTADYATLTISLQAFRYVKNFT
jgi:hypothetical protein